MTILGQEQPVIYRMDDMFDPTTAQMFLNAQQNYVNAMREDYMQTAQDLKNYNKEFADFYSPYEKDNENWDRLAKEPIRDLMANYGPDMLRSQEGRARIAQAIASVPSGQLAKLKASAAQGLQALKVKAELEAKGLYSQDYQDFLDKMNGRTSFKDWDTLKDGVYNSTFSPFQGLGEATDYIYRGRQPLYKGMKNGSRVYSYDYNDLLNTAQSNAQDFIATPRGAFEWDLAQRAARQQNPNASAEDIQKKAYEILDNRIAKANMRYLSPEKYEADPFSLEKYRHDLQMKEINARKAENGDGSGSGKNRGNPGHSHLSENQFRGIAKVTRSNYDDIKKWIASGKTEDMARITNRMKNYQKKNMMKYASSVNMFKDMSTSDAPSTIAKSFGLHVDDNNRVPITGNMANRLYYSDALRNATYGAKTNRKLPNGDTLAKNKRYNPNKHDYKISPTGHVVTVLCRDGRLRTFVGCNVYTKESDTDRTQTVLKNGVQTKEVVNDKHVQWTKQKDMLWYDMHITTQGSYVETNYDKFILNPSYDPYYEPEIEAYDINIGKSMSDTASRSTDETRIE